MDEQELWAKFMQRVDRDIEDRLDRTDFIFPLTREAAKNTPDDHSEEGLEAAGWVHIDNATNEQMAQLARQDVNMFSHVVGEVMNRVEAQAGMVILIDEDGNESLTPRDDLDWQHIPMFMRYLKQKIEQDEAEAEMLDQMLLTFDVSRTARTLAGEEVSPNETFGEVIDKLGKE